MKKWIIEINRLVTTDRQEDWCKRSYPLHPEGCPKVGKLGCPPTVEHITKVMDMDRPMYFVHSEFDLAAHVEKMRRRLPHWSERQLRSVLYWQGTSRKQMKERAAIAQWELGTEMVLSCPEAYGVNVYVTARLHGLKMERIKDLKTCRHVALLGYLKKRMDNEAV